MRKMLPVISLTLVLIFSVSTAFASNGTQIGTVGTRPTAMGSSFRGLADDWSALFWNPAGLTQLDSKWTIGTSVGLIMPSGSYTPLPYPAQMAPFSGMYTDQRDLVDRKFIVPAMGVFYKATEKLTAGLGVYAPFGLGTEWDLMMIPESYGSLSDLKENEHYSDHQVLCIQPTLAYEISDKLSVGLGASYIMGSMTLDMARTMFNPVLADNGWAALQQGAAAIQMLNPQFPDLPGLTADQNRIPVGVNMEGDGSTFGVNAGLLFKVSEKLQIGLSAQYYADLTLEGTFKQTAYFPGDPVKYGVLEALAGALASVPGQEETIAGIQQAMWLFTGQNMVMQGDVEAKMPLPMTFGAGIAYMPTEKLTLTLDAGMTQWNSWDVITIKPTDEGSEVEEDELREDWESTLQFGLGIEYKAMKQLSVLGGFYTVPSPAPDKTLTPTILDPSRRYVITGGLQYGVGSLLFSGTFEYLIFDDKTVESYIFDDMGIAENYAGDYSFSALVFTGGVSIAL